jgi:hypothetical protein
MTAANIAGMGWITPLGRDMESVWQALCARKRLETTPLENPISKKSVPILRVPENIVRESAAAPRLRRSSAISHFAVAAATDAITSARLSPKELARTALVFAASDGGVVYTRRFFSDVVEHGEGAGSPLLFPETVYNAPASHVAALLGLQGEVLTLVGDSAAGIAALRTGWELLAVGEADFCLIVSAQELDWITGEAYSRWGLIQDGSNSASVFSECAAAIVLSREIKSCQVSAIHCGFSCPTEKDIEEGLEAVLKELLPGSRVDIAVSCASGTRLDLAETNCLARYLPATKVLTPKAVLGESLACSAIQQVIIGALGLDRLGGGQALVTVIGYNRQVAGLILTHAGRHG